MAGEQEVGLEGVAGDGLGVHSVEEGVGGRRQGALPRVHPHHGALAAEADQEAASLRLAVGARPASSLQEGRVTVEQAAGAVGHVEAPGGAVVGGGDEPGGGVPAEAVDRPGVELEELDSVGGAGGVQTVPESHLGGHCTMRK